jgi:hypothetical protein
MPGGRGVEVEGDEDEVGSGDSYVQTARETGHGAGGCRREENGLGSLGGFADQAHLAREGGRADEAPGIRLEDDLHLVTGAGDLAGYSGCREHSGARPNAVEDQDL